jgi:ferredoxin-thioredoxin reductase catalytic subunit
MSMQNNQREEAVRRMEMLRMSSQCISAFKRGIVWESEGMGALYECNDEEKKLVEDFEKQYGGVVYHVIHNMFEFGECYSMLYVSKDIEEWRSDRADLEDGYAMAYVKNIDDDLCSEFGTIGIKPSIGGLVRTA